MSFRGALAGRDGSRSITRDLKTLFRDLPVRSFFGNWDTVVEGISMDSRKTGPDSLFFAIKGMRTNGNLFIQEAIERGARAIVTEDTVKQFGNVSVIEVGDFR